MPETECTCCPDPEDHERVKALRHLLSIAHNYWHDEPPFHPWQKCPVLQQAIPGTKEAE